MEPNNRTYDPVAVANFFIQKSLDTGVEVTPMKLLKLVYISHGWSLALLNEPLIDEAVEAWTYGPVIPSLYQELKEYGRSRVTKLVTTNDFDWRSFKPNFTTPTIPEEDTKVQKLLDNVWEGYGNHSGIYLSAITHKPGTPWSLTEPNDIIGQDLIREHYKMLAKA
jgi:uncharacterized phage-associated protein